MENQTKKAASVTAITKADKAMKANQFNSSFPQKEKSVKDKLVEEIADIYHELSPERKQFFVAWTKLYIRNKEFEEAFKAWFTKNQDTAYFEDAVEFLENWKEVCSYN